MKLHHFDQPKTAKSEKPTNFKMFMSRSKNNSELPKNSGSEYNQNEILTKISELKSEISALELQLEKKQDTVIYIAIHNLIASLCVLLQQEHIKLRNYYNETLSK